MAENGREYALNNAWRKYGDPVLTILAETSDHTAAFLLEKHFIKTMNTKTPNGYNMTDGGEGIVGRSEESRKESGQRRKKKYAEDAAFREKMKVSAIKAGPKVSAANKRFYATPEGKEFLLKRSKTEWREKITAANKTPRSAETIKKTSASLKATWCDPEYRKKVNAARNAKQAELRANNSEWVKNMAEKRSIAMKAKWEDPVFLEKMKKRKPYLIPLKTRLAIWERRKASWSPERRAILGAKDKSRYWKVKMLKALALQEKSETNQ
jgi:hypothetical protein